MIKLDRDDIHLISRHSNWSESGVEKALHENVHSDAKSWHTFLRLFFMSLGIGFSVAGIIFFFAYNWVDLHKFVKIGLMEALILLATLFVLIGKSKITLKNIVLTGATVLVGGLYAVYGQIYQTGANAYDFFLGWTFSVTLWVLISNFAPLWLIYLGLINTTLVLYSIQVAHHWSPIFIFTMLFLLNSAFLILSIWLSKVKVEIKIPVWFSNVIALAAITCSTIGLTIAIFDNVNSSNESLFGIIISALILYTAGILYGRKAKSGFYFAIIPFSLIWVCSALFIDISSDEFMLLFVSIFIVATVTLVIRNLISLQKKWAHE